MGYNLAGNFLISVNDESRCTVTLRDVVFTRNEREQEMNGYLNRLTPLHRPDRLSDMMTELWERDDDDWIVWVVQHDDGTVAVSHLPQLVVPPPVPLTYGYVVMALEAHGYGRVDDGPCCDAHIIEGPDRLKDMTTTPDIQVDEITEEGVAATLAQNDDGPQDES